MSTIVLSLDTTAVLLTPVVITVARQLRLNPLPFAMTTVWLANTASLLLPVSNLTNLLALHRFSALGLGHSGYISLALWPALAACSSWWTSPWRTVCATCSPAGSAPAPRPPTSCVSVHLGAGASNAVDNLPAYLALESVTDNDPCRLMALLIGVNVGPLVTIWASLATILWRERWRRAGVTISVWRFAWQGAACAVAATIAAVLALKLA